MNRIEERFKQFALPKFKPGDEIYIVRAGEMQTVLITSVHAAYEAFDVHYEYDAENDDDLWYGLSEEEIYTDKAAAERVCHLSNLKTREESLAGQLTWARDELKRLKGLTPEGIETRIKGCEEDINKWSEDLEDVQKQIKELEEE